MPPLHIPIKDASGERRSFQADYLDGENEKRVCQLTWRGDGGKFLIFDGEGADDNEAFDNACELARRNEEPPQEIDPHDD